MGEAFIGAAKVMTDEPMRDGGKALGTTSEVAKVIEEALRAPKEDMGTTNKVVEILETISGAVTKVEQADYKIYKASGKASNVHSESAGDVSELPVKKGKTTKEAHPKIMRTRWLAPLSIKVTSVGTCSKLLKELIPFKYKEELLQESFKDNAQRCIRALMVVRSPNSDSFSFEGFYQEYDKWYLCKVTL